MRLKTVFRIVNETRYVKKVLRRYRDSLARGKYYQHNSFRALSLDAPDTLVRARIYFDVKKPNVRMANVAKRLNKCGFYRNKNKSSTEEYEAFYISNNYDKLREVKLFSFKAKKILTICTAPTVMETQLAQYERFGKIYPMPRVMRGGKYANSFEIAMIDRQPVESDAAALAHIAAATVAYNPSTKDLARITVADLGATVYEDADINACMQQITAMISADAETWQIPVCVQHGDLSKDNLLYGTCEGKTDFWWIDWEHARERFFFYDFFFYILNSAFCGDMRVYECYMRGEVDEVLAAYFAHFGISFECNRKYDYLLVFALPFLAERVCVKGRLPALKKYLELLLKMGQDVRGV
ncbi:MAG: hypothetical protein IJC99_03490 [Clostridia bacterium]|nr:hypothetical protein [Clostridia bacterium]